MAINNLSIEIMELLKEKNIYLDLKEITNFLNKEKSEMRTISRELLTLVSSHRVKKDGVTANAKYALDDVRRYYKKFDFLYVHKKDEIAGYLFRLPDSFRFIYSNDFIINLTDAIPTIDLNIDYVDFENIPAIFEDNLPEGINKDIVEIQNKAIDDFEMLSIFNDNIGDLIFSKTEELTITQKKSVSYLSVLEDMLGDNPKINVLKDFTFDMEESFIFPEGKDLSAQEMKKNDGISGYQYKRIVGVDFDEKVISKEKGNDYIFKPFSKIKANKDNDYYFPHIAVNEHLFMSFAKNELDLEVPYSGILKREDDEEFHYIVKRFDKYDSNRFAKITFAPYLGLTRETKYETTSEKMFTRIAREIISPREKMKLLKHYAYSVIIQHEDMHTKNLSLIHENGKVFFAPLYDIACTGVYDTTKHLDSTLTINGKNKNIRPNDFKNLCKTLKVDFKDFKKEVLFMSKLYQLELPLYLEELKKQIGFIPFYKSRLKKKVGNEPEWVRENDAIDFCDALLIFHQKRVNQLKELGWILDN